jgi:UDP-N-acetylbacillosamine N-acetyltransferase
MPDFRLTKVWTFFYWRFLEDSSMNLLILGAGGHGKVVAEIAEDIGYDKIAFLDDNSSEAIGKIDDFSKFKGLYENAFVGIGNNRLRGEWINKLQECGYTVPTLIHPSAYVSRTATVGIGTVVEPKAVVNANSCIGDGCIISVGAIVDHDVEIGEYCHINAGAIVKAGGTIESFRKLEAGEVVLGYEQAAVKPAMKPADSNDPFTKEYYEQTGKEVSFF